MNEDIYRVMKMRRVILSILFASLLFLQTGCQTVIVSGKKLESVKGITIIGPEDRASWTSEVVGSNVDSSSFGGKIEQQRPFRIKYHPSYTANHWMVVEGSLGNESSSYFAKSSQNKVLRKYPVILDTGASVGLFVNDIHIMENKLTICPFEHRGVDSVGWGMCRVPELNIGQLTLLNWPCHYREQHTELQLLGIRFEKGKAIIAGLATLRKFKYIAFDSVNEEVELSLKEVFEPEQPGLWAKYSFSIEEDLGGSVFLFVKIPIAGRQVELQLDTGSGRGLAITRELWEQMPEKVRCIKLTRARDLYPYIGQLLCKRGVATELEVGGRTVRNAQISVFPDDSPIVDQCSGMLGMQYFQDTVMVLDFERDLMWVKHPPCS
jgi:hypothetical protein